MGTYEKFTKFLNEYLHVGPAAADEEAWLLFITYLAVVHKWKATTITSGLSAISYVLSMKGLQSSDYSKCFTVKAMLKALQRQKEPDSRRPISLHLLEMLTGAMKPTVYETELYNCMYSLMFFGLLRIGEVCVTYRNNLRNVLFVQDVEFNHDSTTITLHMAQYKHSKGREAAIVLSRSEGMQYCPVRTTQRYLYLRGSQPGPLFLLANGAPVNRQVFVMNLKRYLTCVGESYDFYKPHSFRIGGACYVAELGFSDAQIRKLGRWQSDAFKKYLRAFAVQERK